MAIVVLGIDLGKNSCLARIAAALNARGVPTARGGKWPVRIDDWQRGRR